MEKYFVESDSIIYSNMISLEYKQIKNFEILLNVKILTKKDTLKGYFFVEKAVAYQKVCSLALFCTIDKKEILEMLFNSNSLDLIYGGDLSIYPSSIKKIDRFIVLLKKYNEDPHDYFLDSTAPMALYGIRPIGDLDFLTKRNYPNGIEVDDKIENNNKYIKYHSVKLDDLLSNDVFYLLYKGLKIVSLDELKRWKLKKGTNKDKEDVFLIENFQESSLKGQVKRRYILLKRSFKILVFKIYKYTLYSIVKK